MTARYRLLAVLLSIVAVVGLAISFVPFHVLESQTDANSSVGTSQANNATAPVGGPVRLVVLEDSAFAERFETELATQLESRWDSVERLEEPVAGDSPILVVGISRSNLRYNPVSPAADVNVEFAFVGSGNGTLAAQFARGESPIVLSNENPYVVQGEISVQDRSTGFASLPGYRNKVSAETAARLAAALGDAPGM